MANVHMTANTVAYGSVLANAHYHSRGVNDRKAERRRMIAAVDRLEAQKKTKAARSDDG